MTTVKTYNALKRWAAAQGADATDAAKAIAKVIKDWAYQVDHYHIDRKSVIRDVHHYCCDEYFDNNPELNIRFRAAAHEVKEIINAYK